MTIYESINSLVGYALTTNLISKDDIIYTQNNLIKLFKLEDFKNNCNSIPYVKIEDLELILKSMLDYAIENDICKDTVVSRDLFDTKVMGCLVERPSAIRLKFSLLYNQSPKKATSWYYKFCQDTDYIRRYRISKDLKWKSQTEYGYMDITINLSKPEKDPKDIAALVNEKNVKYPQCLLCAENEGYAGRMNHPARQNHRIITINLQNEEFGFQYSPYVYYNEHCIVFSMKHAPMKITNKTWRYLFDFVNLFPHYTIGSNADLPIVGGSILTHNHFQGGNYDFPMASAPIEKSFTIKNFEDINCGIVKWPMSVIRLSSIHKERIALLADRIYEKWSCYTDKDAFVFAETENQKHNTLNPIVRRRGDFFELDLVLRNNITTKEHPLGVFHPHKGLHHIKKENIGLIEVMGLAILPGRLKTELASLSKAIIEQKNIAQDEILSKHAIWVQEFLRKYSRVDSNNIEKIIQDEVGIVFSKVLEDAGVYKRNKNGIKLFERFINSI